MSKNVFKQVIKVQNLIGEKKTRLSFGLLVGLTSMMVVGVAPFDHYLTRQIKELDQEIEKLKPQADEIQKKIKSERFKYTKENPLVALYPQTTRLEEGRSSFAKELELLMKNHVQDVWLTKISFNRLTKEAVLEGHATDATRVNQYFDKLTEEKELDGYHLKDLSMEEKPFSSQKSSEAKGKETEASGIRAYSFTIKTKKEGA